MGLVPAKKHEMQSTYHRLPPPRLSEASTTVMETLERKTYARLQGQEKSQNYKSIVSVDGQSRKNRSRP